jgi:microcystin degradation protein MlrC
VQQCVAAGVGETVDIALGAEHVSRPKMALSVSAEVQALGDRLNLGGFQPYRTKEAAWARVRIGSVFATFHARAIGITTPPHLEAMGIHPKRHRAYVVKLGYLHPQLEDIAPRHILLLSDGGSQLDLTRLRWDRLRRPMIPLDADFAWQPADGLYGDS